jgi:hypothetical protein
VTPELSRKFAVARIGAGVRFMVEANERERAALASRMGLPAVLALTCRFDLQPAARGVVVASGHLESLVVQSCVVSMEDFEAPVVEDFLARFVPEGQEAPDIDPEAPDEIPYEGTHIDLGEAAAEQLALALPPFPRRPGVVFADDPSPDA